MRNCNSGQREAILHDHAKNGPLLILAGAGSGKTSVLTRRIQWLVTQQNIPPESILGLTFTAKAAQEMLDRVGDTRIRLCTFHSLALSLLREKMGIQHNWKRLGFARAPTPSESSVRHWDDQVVNCGLKAGSLERELLFAPVDQPCLQKAQKKLQSSCLTSGNVVFEDLIWLSIRLLEEHSEVTKDTRKRWKYVLVDEYQDINPSQYRLVRLLLGDNPNFFVVGDDDQAIYGFRGADIGNILRFQSDYPDCKVIKLEWNYRSTAPILNLANRIFLDKPPQLIKRLRPGCLRTDLLFREAHPVQIWWSAYPGEEMDRICGTIGELRIRHGLPFHAFALLLRFNRQKEWFFSALQRRGIPIFGEEEPEGVHLETVHGSKGLQYPVVFYCGLAEGLTPGSLSGNRAQRKAQAAEERRLFYVGVTRAEARLVLLFCSRRHWHGKKCDFKPSRFLRYGDGPQQNNRYRRPKLPMCYKTTVTIRVLAYMARAMLEQLMIRILHPKDVDAWLEHRLDTWAHFCLQIIRLDLHVQGQANLASVDWQRPVFVISNHQSYTDIPTILVSLQRKLGFLAKFELGYIPFLGYWMEKIGCLMVKRGKAGSGQAVNKAIHRMKKAPNLVVFPEGTRSKDGLLHKFKTGVFRMAIDHRAILVPLVIHGTRSGWESRKSFNAFHPIHCQILKPIDCAQILDKKPKFSHRELMDQVRPLLESAIHETGTPDRQA
ncbi:MAG TPA: UvrD-helicase domain-containing protein [Fibrobacteraceae bacterium]|nr:UvrD-helicase domain-containing protein [Fibrobacteraceae bacterium]